MGAPKRLGGKGLVKDGAALGVKRFIKGFELKFGRFRPAPKTF